ncbi:hypothetical protein Z947_430 [Sulfitobacter geojensis]|nr:hypothetical protein Z947_430 [Sulfitobacter geojensis]
MMTWIKDAVGQTLSNLPDNPPHNAAKPAETPLHDRHF